MDTLNAQTMSVSTRGGIAALLIFVSVAVSSQSVESLLSDIPSEIVAELRTTGSVERYFENHRDVALIPDHPLARHIAAAVRDTKPNVISEQLVLVEASIGEQEILDLYNSLRRVSELSYIRYTNERTERTHDLFHESRAIRSPRDRRVVNDPIVDTIPTDSRIWVLQGVPPFGDIVSEYHYRSDGRAFLFFGTNHDALPYRGVDVVRSGRMVTAILVIPTDQYVLMYGLGGVRAFTVFGLLDGRIEAAFSGRTDGIFSWYYRTYLAPLD